MTLNEKLNVIADLEEENLSEEIIGSIIEDIENPEPRGKRYSAVEELMSDLESE